MCTENFNELKEIAEETKEAIVDAGQILMKQVESHDEKFVEVLQLLMGQIQEFQDKVMEKLEDIENEI